MQAIRFNGPQKPIARQRARLAQAAIRLNEGIVGELPGYGLCVHTRAAHLKIGNWQIFDRRRPLIGLADSEDITLTTITRRVNRRVDEVVTAINELWFASAKSGNGLHAARKQRAALN